jgi:molecular chaperone GrpE
MNEEHNQQENGADGAGPSGAQEAGDAGGTASSPGAAPAGDRVAALETEKAEIRERMLRIAAEFENFKKRTRREQADAEAKAKEGVLRDILEIADNLERAVAVAESTDPKALVQGVQLVLRLFQNKLERYDVKPVEALGQPFDPRVHDAISQVPTADAPPGSVVNEVQRGYKIGDRLLRPALVAVAVAPASAAVASPGSGDKA